MALTDAQASALLVLLEAPSKQAVDAFFCSCFRERQRHAAGSIDDARVAEIVESLGLSTPLAAAPLQRAAIALIGKVLYADASAEQTAALFPPDFHSSLQALLTKVVPSRWLTQRPPCGTTTRPPLSQPWARLLPLLLLGIVTLTLTLSRCSTTRRSGAPRAWRPAASRRCPSSLAPVGRCSG